MALLDGSCSCSLSRVSSDSFEGERSDGVFRPRPDNGRLRSPLLGRRFHVRVPDLPNEAALPDCGCEESDVGLVMVVDDRASGDLRAVSSGALPLAEDEGLELVRSGPWAPSTSFIFVSERGERGRVADGGVLACDWGVCGEAFFCGEIDLARSAMF